MQNPEANPTSAHRLSTEVPVLTHEQTRELFERPEVQSYIAAVVLQNAHPDFVLDAHDRKDPATGEYTTDNIDYLNRDQKGREGHDHRGFSLDRNLGYLGSVDTVIETEAKVDTRTISEIVSDIKADKAAISAAKKKAAPARDRTMIEDRAELLDSNINAFADKLALSGQNDDRVLDLILNSNKLGLKLTKAEQVKLFSRVAEVQEEMNDSLLDLNDANAILHNKVQEYMDNGGDMALVFRNADGSASQLYLDYDRHITAILDATSSPVIRERLLRVANDKVQGVASEFIARQAQAEAATPTTSEAVVEEATPEDDLIDDINLDELVPHWVETVVDDQDSGELNEQEQQPEDEAAKAAKELKDRAKKLLARLSDEKQFKSYDKKQSKSYDEDKIKSYKYRFAQIRRDAAKAARKHNRINPDVPFAATEEAVVFRRALDLLAREEYLPLARKAFKEMAADKREDAQDLSSAGTKYAQHIMADLRRLDRGMHRAEGGRRTNRVSDWLNSRRNADASSASSTENVPAAEDVTTVENEEITADELDALADGYVSALEIRFPDVRDRIGAINSAASREARAYIAAGNSGPDFMQTTSGRTYIRALYQVADEAYADYIVDEELRNMTFDDRSRFDMTDPEVRKKLGDDFIEAVGSEMWALSDSMNPLPTRRQRAAAWARRRTSRS